MSHIVALDEITARLGPPLLLRWVEAPFGATAAIIRVRHRNSAINLSASGVFRLIFHISSSEVVRESSTDLPSRQRIREGSVITSFTRSQERLRVVGSADTLHLLFSSELTKACVQPDAQSSAQIRLAMESAAAQLLVATTLEKSDTKLQQIVASVATTLIEQNCDSKLSSGGLAPRAVYALRERLQRSIENGVSVPELAEIAGLSLHHFIKVFRQSEGLTPHALLLQMRMERAIELLLGTTATVDEVAIRTGFSSSSHFVSTFARMIGVTPARLRRAAA
jgi:AraC-like DNA-binding protein